MKIILTEQVQAKRLLEGFPGFGLVGPIVTEYLIEQLHCKPVGYILYDQLPATVAVHKGKLVQPLGIYYSEKHDLLLLHAIIDVKGVEWDIVQAIEELVKQTGIKEIVSLEGVAGNHSEEVYCFNSESFEQQGAKPIQESVIVGVTAGLLVRKLPVHCLFAQTQSNLPDSRAAANIISFLEKHYGFSVDTQPLLEQAALVEEKVKSVLSQTAKTVQEVDKKQMSYLG